MPPSTGFRLSRRRMTNLRIFRDVLLIRLANAFWLTTFFQPDEYFQSLEPAWNLAFGPESGAWITWEWHHQLRSSIHPAIFSGAYLAADKVSQMLSLDTAWRHTVLLAAPRILQGLFAALGDFFTWKLAHRIYGSGNTALAALFLQIFSPWQWYVSTRTFSNSLETTITAAALYCFPWTLATPAKLVKENPGRSAYLALLKNLSALRLSLTLAALAVVLRPTNILIWLTIIAVIVTGWPTNALVPKRLQHTLLTVLVLFREVFYCGSIVLLFSMVCDRLFYGSWAFPPYEWLHFNITQSLAVFYGRNPWHYYLLQGLPLLCTTSLPFALMALYKPRAATLHQANILRILSCAVMSTIFALSQISHKEVRFIYPLLPILTVLSAPYAAKFFTMKIPPPPSSNTAKPSSTPRSYRRLQNTSYLAAALSINALLAGYLSHIHQSAPLNVVAFLRDEYTRLHPAQLEEEGLFALFLMPCHSTPWRSHLIHPSLRAYALSCEPPLHTEANTPERLTYRDEADRFYDDPVGFLRREMFALNTAEGHIEIPKYIVGFEGIEPWLTEYLATDEGKRTKMRLEKVWEGSNGLFSEDWRRAGKMIVWDTGA